MLHALGVLWALEKTQLARGNVALDINGWTTAVWIQQCGIPEFVPKSLDFCRPLRSPELK